MRDIYADDNLHERFLDLLEEPDERDRLYVYRLDDANRPIKPALIKGRPFRWLETHLRIKHGGGTFRIMIRRGEKMLLTGMIYIGAPGRAT
jgi:hypothetical protein